MEREYGGTELHLFARATRWKSYVARRIRRYVKGHVLEVGAGIGENIPHLINASVSRWSSLEPDANLARETARLIASDPSLSRCTIETGTIADLPAEARFDAILYMDVLEHIEDDQAELVAAAGRLVLGGSLIVLAPAHQFLFSPFDAAIGHYRRYGLAALRSLTPPGTRLREARLLDSVGFFASLANRLLLRQSDPTASQILFWDRVLVPLSRVLDPVTAFRFGKSALVVWTRYE